MKENELEVVNTNIINEDALDTTIVISEHLKRNNELVEYHNNILTENKKLRNINIIINICYKLFCIPIIIFFIFKIYVVFENNSKRETNIINQMPKLDVPAFNITTPTPKVNINNHISDKISFYENGDYSNPYTYKNTSKNVIYCRTNNYSAYNIVLPPNSTINSNKIYSCKDAELIEIVHK